MGKIGYIRVSSVSQNLDRQIESLNSVGVDKLFTDKLSGKDTNRQGFQDMMNYIREGDTLYIHSLDRLSRSLSDTLHIIEDLEKRGVKLVSLHEQLDTSTPQGRFFINITSSFAQLERELLKERQREGIIIARENGKYKGRARKKFDEDLFISLVKEINAGKRTAKSVYDELGMSAPTFYRRLREYEQANKL